MNEELQSRLLAYLDKIEQGGDYLISEAPAVAQEIIAVNLFYGYITLGLSIIPLILSLVCLICFVKILMKEDGDAVGAAGFTTIFFLVGIIPALIGTSMIYKSHYAPRMVIIEKLHYMTLERQ